MFESNKSNDINVGLNLLKIISMLMIVTLHILGKGGVLANLSTISLNYALGWYLEIICYSAVNCYAMITGYIYINKRIKFKNIVLLWAEVFFYSFFINLVFFIINFLFNLKMNIHLVDIFTSFFPVISSKYWYFKSYFALFFFIPFLNEFLNGLSKKAFQLLLFVLIIFYSIFQMLALREIFSIPILFVMYVIGAFISKFSTSKVLNYKYLLIFFANSLFILFSRYFFILISKLIFNKSFAGLFISNYSVFIILNCIVLFKFCVNLSFDKQKIQNIVNIIAGFSFSVYLIHEHKVISNLFILNKFTNFSKYSTLYFLTTIILTAVIIYCICIVIEIFRTYLFDYFNITYKLILFASSIEIIFYKSLDSLLLKWNKMCDG